MNMQYKPSPESGLTAEQVQNKKETDGRISAGKSHEIGRADSKGKYLHPVQSI